MVEVIATRYRERVKVTTTHYRERLEVTTTRERLEVITTHYRERMVDRNCVKNREGRNIAIDKGTIGRAAAGTSRGNTTCLQM